MWMKKNLKEAALQYLLDIGGDLYYDLSDAYFPHGEYDDVEKHIMNAFVAGCQYIINNTQKETEK
jgi:hypothetical protein